MTVAPEIPRFDDGMTNLRKFITPITEALINEIIDVQADERARRATAEAATAAGPHDERGYHRVARTKAQDRDVLTGRPTHEELARRPGGDCRGVEDGGQQSERAQGREGSARTRVESMSASQASRVCASLDETTEDLQTRDFKSPPTIRKRTQSTRTREECDSVFGQCRSGW